MKIRHIKYSVYARMRKLIPHTSNGVTYLSNELQLIRIFGRPDFRSAYVPEHLVRPINQLGAVRFTETDFSQIVGNDEVTKSIVVSRDTGPK